MGWPTLKGVSKWLITLIGRDSSTLLKYLRLKCVIIDSPTVSDAVQDKNLILLGCLDAIHTSEIMRGLMTAEDMEMIRTAGWPGPALVR